MLKINKSIFLFILILFLQSSVLTTLLCSQSKLPIEINYQINNAFMRVNGQVKEIDPGTKNSPILIKEWGRTAVPIRSLVESLGGTVAWESSKKKVTIYLKGSKIEMWIGDPNARVNDLQIWIDETNHNVRPIILNNRTYIPLRFVSETLGSKVEWINNSQTIKITFPDSIVKLPDDEIVAEVKAQDTLTFKIPIKNPFMWKTTIRIKLLSNDCPKDWSSDFCVKNTCYFREGEIDLLSKESAEILVSVYTINSANANYSLIIAGDEIPEEIIKISIKEGD